MLTLVLFWKYYRRAHTKYRIHSPRVYQFIADVLEDDRAFYAYDQLDQIREVLSKDNTLLSVTDLGAGSRTLKSTQRTVKEIAQTSVVSKADGAFLFRLLQMVQPATILELGTSLGLSALYLHWAYPQAPLVTIEGCPAIAEYARAHTLCHANGKITSLVGSFEDKLSEALAALPSLGLVLFDGNHSHAPTMAYFEQCLERADDNTVFVFDDIYWSADMLKAWEVIKAHPRVRLTIDIYHYGIVFFIDDAPIKRNFVLCPYAWKPWETGLFSPVTGA